MSWFSGNNSEVARLRQQIEDECDAMANMDGFAAVGKHEAIRQRADNIGAAKRDLAKHVGEEQAAKIMYGAYSKAMDGGSK